MITHLLIAMLGAGIYLRIVGKEKYRRHRHLLYRVEAKRQQEEEEKAIAEAATQFVELQAKDPIVIQPKGVAAA